MFVHDVGSFSNYHFSNTAIINFTFAEKCGRIPRVGEIMHTDLATIDRIERQNKAMELRRQGLSLDAIAKELHVSHTTVKVDIQEAMKLIQWSTQEKALELRTMIEERNNVAIQAIYKAIQAGDYYAIDRLIKIQDQLLKLLGPSQIDITSGGNPISQGIQTIEVILSDVAKDEPLVLE